jgi:hypothetical protein
MKKLIIFILMMLPARAYCQVPCSQANAICVFHFDENTGVTTNDCKNGQTMTLNGSPTWQSGQSAAFGSCLDFTGAGYLNYATTSYMAGIPQNGDDYTIMVWIYPKTTSGGDKDIIWWGVAGPNKLVIISYDYPGGRQISLNHYANDWSTGYQPQLSSWTHITARHVHSTDKDTLFVNGVFYADHTIGTGLSISDKNLHVGGGWSKDFPGSIDDVVIFNTALSDADVRTIFLSAPAPPGSVKKKPNIIWVGQ